MSQWLIPGVGVLVRLRVAVARNDRTIAMLVGLVVGSFFLADGIRSL